MLLILTSPESLALGGKPNLSLVQALKQIRAQKIPVGIVSNHTQPDWFDATFNGSGIQFLKTSSRQTGEIISVNTDNYQLNPFDALVLATKEEDVQMGKNGGAILIAGGWSSVQSVTSLGICVKNPAELIEVINLISGWLGEWWFSGDNSFYEIKALSDLSGINQTDAQKEFANKLTYTVKQGGPKLNALLTIAARSLLMDGLGGESGLVWGVYPSSKSANNGNEILSDFTHRLRTTVSRSKFCKRDEPLFIRHTQSTKRSSSRVNDRADPSEQMETINLNPYYKDKGRLIGKHVVVVDDCTTYGVSFGVAAAFLKKAGAKKVTGVALGKFGNQLQFYDVEIKTDPFRPVLARGYVINSSGSFPGQSNTKAKDLLRVLLG